MISTSMMNAMPKKKAMPRTPASLPRFSKVSWHQEGRVGDMRNVEQAERHRQPDAHGGIETAEQQSKHHRAEQQVQRKHLKRPPP
jgi:hypothetical protein